MRASLVLCIILFIIYGICIIRNKNIYRYRSEDIA